MYALYNHYSYMKQMITGVFLKNSTLYTDKYNLTSKYLRMYCRVLCCYCCVKRPTANDEDADNYKRQSIYESSKKIVESSLDIGNPFLFLTLK